MSELTATIERLLVGASANDVSILVITGDGRMLGAYEAPNPRGGLVCFVDPPARDGYTGPGSTPDPAW